MCYKKLGPMRSKGFRWFVVALAVLWLMPHGRASAQSISEEASLLVEALAKQLVARRTPRVAAIDFTDIQGRPNELGRFLADLLSVELFGADGVIVIDRANLDAILAEHKLTATGLVDPANARENARKLGLSGVDAIVVGTLTTIDGAAVLAVRAISTNTSEVVAAGRMRVALSEDVRRMLGASVSISRSGASPSAATSTSGRDVASGSVAPPVSVGPVVVTVRNVSYSQVGEGASRHPQISVTLELENRNLDASVAVAANSQVIPQSNPSGNLRAPTTGRIFGDLQDSSRSTWLMDHGSLRGVPVVFCFETESINWRADAPIRTTQSAPSNVASYIKSGVEYDGSALRNVTQRMWGGGFASIGPGGKLEMSAVFVPSQLLEMRAGRGGLGRTVTSRMNTGAAQSSTPPESFDLSLELVLATVKQGQRPAQAADLALRNLVVSGLVLPQASQ